MSQPDPESARRSRSHALRRLGRAFVSPNSYGLVLLLIVVTYVLAVAARGPWAGLILLAQIVTVWIGLRTSKASRPVRLVADAALVAAAVVAVIQLVGDWADDEGLLFIASCVLYFIAPISVIRHLATRDTVDQETVLGAVAAYLLIGMFFAFLYRFVAAVQSGPFFGSEGDGSGPQSLFFSFTTLTTTGYGNLVPATNPGQTLAVAEMLIGQLFLIGAVGRVVTAWQPRRRSAVTTRDEPEA